MTKASWFGVCAELVAWKCGVTGRKRRMENQEGLGWNSASLRLTSVCWIRLSHTFLMGEQGVLNPRMLAFPHSLHVGDGSARLRTPFARQPTLGRVLAVSLQLLHLWDLLPQLLPVMESTVGIRELGIFARCRFLSWWVFALLYSGGLNGTFPDCVVVSLFFFLGYASNVY